MQQNVVPAQGRNLKLPLNWQASTWRAIFIHKKQQQQQNRYLRVFSIDAISE